MNQEEHSFSKTPINLSFDDFEISAESFKPVTKGLGFHQEQKKTTFKPVTHAKMETLRPTGPLNNISRDLEVRIKKQTPTGLEAFYGASSVTAFPTPEALSEVKISNAKTADIQLTVSPLIQFSAWLIDLIIILGLVVITGTCLVLTSGIDYSLILKLVSRSDLLIFSSSVFAIYYILYFTILDLSATLGKIIFGIRLAGTDNNGFSVKNTFVRSVVSLLSMMVFCFPMFLDFQGRLSDTKIIK